MCSESYATSVILVALRHTLAYAHITKPYPADTTHICSPWRFKLALCTCVPSSASSNTQRHIDFDSPILVRSLRMLHARLAFPAYSPCQPEMIFSLSSIGTFLLMQGAHRQFVGCFLCQLRCDNHVYVLLRFIFKPLHTSSRTLT